MEKKTYLGRANAGATQAKHSQRYPRTSITLEPIFIGLFLVTEMKELLL
jgi:hypothetical protein